MESSSLELRCSDFATALAATRMGKYRDAGSTKPEGAERYNFREDRKGEPMRDP